MVAAFLSSYALGFVTVGLGASNWVMIQYDEEVSFLGIVAFLFAAGLWIGTLEVPGLG